MRGAIYMPDWLKDILPIITLILGVLLEMLREYIKNSNNSKKEFEKNRFSSLIYPLHLYVNDYKHSCSNITKEFLEDICEFSNKLFSEYAFYATQNLLNTFHNFSVVVGLLNEGTLDLNAARISYEIFLKSVEVEYMNLSIKILQPISSTDISVSLKKDKNFTRYE